MGVVFCEESEFVRIRATAFTIFNAWSELILAFLIFEKIYNQNQGRSQGGAPGARAPPQNRKFFKDIRVLYDDFLKNFGCSPLKMDLFLIHAPSPKTKSWLRPWLKTI